MIFWKTLLPNFKKGVEAMQSSPPCAKDMSNNEVITIQNIIVLLNKWFSPEFRHVIDPYFPFFPRVIVAQLIDPEIGFTHCTSIPNQMYK